MMAKNKVERTVNADFLLIQEKKKDYLKKQMVKWAFYIFMIFVQILTLNTK